MKASWHSDHVCFAYHKSSTSSSVSLQGLNEWIHGGHQEEEKDSKRDKYVAVVYQLRFCQRKESFDFDIVFK